MSILAPSLKITLDRERKMTFDLNAFSAYEEATGKFFLDTIMDLADRVRESTERPEQILRRISLKDIRALLWATLSQEDPKLTIQQVGKMITPDNILDVLVTILRGHAENAPEPKAEEAAVSSGPFAVTPLTAEDGGTLSGAPDEAPSS